MLTFTLTGVISLLRYENPSISQYTVFDSRDNNIEVNMDDSYGEFAFGFIDLTAGKFVPPDPAICSFQAQSVSVDWANPIPLDVSKEHELQAVSREKNIKLFSNGSGLNDFDTSGLYVIKDKS